MTHDPTRDCEHGRLKGKCDVCDLQAEVLEQCRINGMSAEREDALRAELTRLKASIALDKMAENARELGLSYDTPLSSFVRSSDEAKAEVMERVIDKAIEAQKEKIGCVNHDCDQCKAVQEQVALELERIAQEPPVNGNNLAQARVLMAAQRIRNTTPPTAQPAVQEGRDWSLLEATQESLREHMAEIKRLKAAQPAPVMTDEKGRPLSFWGGKSVEPIAQPAPVKTYHDGKPWPVAPKPWVGLTDEEAQWIYDNGRTPSGMMEMVETKLKEKNT
jgi:hypothetical protein